MSEDALPALPQQQIVEMTDGHVSSSALGESARVGTSRQAVVARLPVSLSRGGPWLESDGVVTVEVSADCNGIVEVVAPAFVTTSQEHGRTSWPCLVAQAPTLMMRRRVFQGDGGRLLRFDQPGEALTADVTSKCRSSASSDDGVAGNVVVVCRPGDAEVGQAALDPPDGTLLACCVVGEGVLVVVQQFVAWGGGGQAYEMQHLYGITEANRTVPDAATSQVDESAAALASTDSQRNCVICLTEPRSTALMPCGHFCVCYECGASLRLAPARNRCPLCRREVRDIMHIDVTVDAASSLEVPPSLEPETQEVLVDSETAPAAAGAELLPVRCLQRVSRELMKVQELGEQHAQDHGVELSLSDPSGGDLRAWSLKLLTACMDDKCSLFQQLRRVGANSVELEIWITEAFPIEPPVVRVLRPYFKSGSFYVHQHGALCMELLTKQGWSPATSLLQLGVHVKTTMMSGSGHISDLSPMGEPGSDGLAGARAMAKQLEKSHANWARFDESGQR